jgi:putative mycofactocin binding protein MftB
MTVPIDLARPWALCPSVALRPEPFGALAYDFSSRRLSFLKTQVLAEVVRGLADHPSALEACVAAGVGSDQLPRYEQALGALAASGMIRERDAA